MFCPANNFTLMTNGSVDLSTDSDLNTFAHKLTSNYKPPLALTLFRTRVIGEFLVKGLNLFVRGFLLRQGVVKRDRPTSKPTSEITHNTGATHAERDDS